MNRTQLDSSNVLSAGYDEETKILEVEFVGNRIYRYFNVEKVYYDNLISAPSPGWYFQRIINPLFRSYEQIEEEE